MSEAVSGSTLYAPDAPFPRHGYAVIAATILWALTGFFAVLDIIDGFPRGVVVTSGAAASSMTLLAGLMRLGTVTQARYAEIGRSSRTLDRRTERIEQMATQHGHDLEAMTRLATSLAGCMVRLDESVGGLNDRVEQALTQVLTRELAHRETLRRVLADPARHDGVATGVLDRSAYWQVYSDVMTDLGGLGGEEPPPAVTSN